MKSAHPKSTQLQQRIRARLSNRLWQMSNGLQTGSAAALAARHSRFACRDLVEAAASALSGAARKPPRAPRQAASARPPRPAISSLSRGDATAVAGNRRPPGSSPCPGDLLVFFALRDARWAAAFAAAHRMPSQNCAYLALPKHDSAAYIWPFAAKLRGGSPSQCRRHIS
jgi:hypothetical protein